MEQTTGNINEVNVEMKGREREVSYRKFKALGRKPSEEPFCGSDDHFGTGVPVTL